MRKKASLNLSINAIVVLVMAITLLGLGLAFIRGKMMQGGKLIDDVEQNVKQSIAEDFANSDAKLSFPRTTFKLKSSDEHVFAMGIKNTEPQEQGFLLKLEYISGPNDCGTDVTNCNGNEIETSDSVDDGAGNMLALQFYGTYEKIEVQDYVVVPLKIITHGAGKSDTYFIRAEVCEYSGFGSNCDTDPSTGDDVIYAQKEFFIEIV